MANAFVLFQDLGVGLLDSLLEILISGPECRFHKRCFVHSSDMFSSVRDVAV